MFIARVVDDVSRAVGLESGVEIFSVLTCTCLRLFVIFRCLT